jgi:hypothetical protein
LYLSTASVVTFVARHTSKEWSKMLPTPAKAHHGASASSVVLGERAEGIVKFCDGDGASYFELFPPTDLAEPLSQ